MDTRLYQTKLANHKIFKDLKGSFGEYSGTKLRNLIALQDDVLYVWNSVENCLFCVNVKHLEEHEDETPYQKLHFLTPPAFTVERVIGSECGNRICVWGSRGVTVAELQSRWGRGGLFDSGNQTVLCKSFSLDERFLYSQGEIHRVHWHPKSLSHLLVLVSDNTMRLYNIALKSGPKLVKSFSVGPKPTGSLGMTLLDSFGDSAVDFAPTPDTEHLLILSGNGDVFMVNSDFLESKRPLAMQVSGPLRMFPPADDNYGSESCAILCVGAAPAPLVVIATASAALYHCLLLPHATENKDGDGHALYVIECVELNINVTNDAPFAYPVQLFPCGAHTYGAWHARGAHAVSLPVMAHLRDYALADEGEIESILSLISSKSSVARHLVYTGSNSQPLGLCATPPPLHQLLVLCGDELVTRTLDPYDLEDQLFREVQLKNPALDDEDISEILKERQKLSFTAIVQEILSRELSQPILKMNKTSDPSPKECLEILSQATIKLRGQYISRQERALSALRTKVSSLVGLAHQQLSWHQELKSEINNVQQQSSVLLEKRNLAEKKQEDLKQRCSLVVRALRSGAARSGGERDAARQLGAWAARVRALQPLCAAAAAAADSRRERVTEWREEYKRKDTALGKSHSDTISSILQQQTHQISTLIEETKLLKDQLGVV